MLEKNNKIWDKVSNSIKKRFVNEPVYNEKYLKSYKNFDDDEIPKELSDCTCVLLMLIDSAFQSR